MIYIILAVVSIIMLFGTICTCFKVGQVDGICKYNTSEDE